MVRLALFELSKVWRRRAFVLSALALLAVNVFILWYSSLGGPSAPGLASYKRLHADISGMSGEEKHAYVGKLRETVDGVTFVENVLLLRASGMGEQFAEQELAENPGVFEKYYDIYTSGAYLRYTDSLAAEKAFIDRIYGEESKVYGYESYLQEIQERENLLGGISIFGDAQQEDSFSARNIRKSAADHATMTTEGVSWIPSAPVTAPAQNLWADLLVIALTFLFVTGLVSDEKLKGLAAVTRATKRGVVPTITAKLLALLVYCFVTETVFFTVNVLFSGVVAGWWDLSVRLQSVAAYRESSLKFTVLEFYALSVAAKSLTLFAAFALITGLCIVSGRVTVPYFGGAALWVVSFALWRFVPAASAASLAKHLNLFALLRTESIFGAYLNLNLGGKPVSRLVSSLGLGLAIALVGVVLDLFLYRRPVGQTAERALRPRPWPFRPHASLTRHEAYKLLITNHGLAILLVFTCLIAAQSLSNAYTPSSTEQYYQSVMLSLEGELTEEKEALIASEKARFDEAFEEIRQIDAAVASGEISEDVGDTLKANWQAVTAFYPAFEEARQLRLALPPGGAGRAGAVGLPPSDHGPYPCPVGSRGHGVFRRRVERPQRHQNGRRGRFATEARPLRPCRGDFHRRPIHFQGYFHSQSVSHTRTLNPGPDDPPLPGPARLCPGGGTGSGKADASDALRRGHGADRRAVVLLAREPYPNDFPRVPAPGRPLCPVRAGPRSRPILLAIPCIRLVLYVRGADRKWIMCRQEEKSGEQGWRWRMLCRPYYRCQP